MLFTKHIALSEFQSISLTHPVTILAESGGTKTDWRIKHDNDIYGFETCNFHPKTIGTEQQQILTLLQKQIPTNSSLYFFGSGCLSIENQEIIRQLFTDFHFKNIEIHSDLVAAGKAIWNQDSGVVGILGTGSVLCNYSKQGVDTILGGFGYLLGDEGSGYHFGKMALQHYLHEKCSIEYANLIENNYGTKREIIQKVYSEEGKSFVGQFRIESQNEQLQQEINEIHKNNISLFIDLYLTKNQQIKEIGFVGSYAFYHKDLLEKLLKERTIALKTVIQKPIDHLLNQYFITN